MKKLLAIILTLALIFCFAACGETKTGEDDKNESSAPVSSRTMDPEDIDDDEVDVDSDVKEPLVLTGDDEYVVVGHSDAEMLTSIKDIKGKKVGMIYETDSQKIAEYYDAVCLGYGTDHDAYSGMSDRTKLDYIIVSKVSAADRVSPNSEYKIILEKIVVE